MSFSPMTTAVSKATPYENKLSHIDAINAQEAIDKLAWLFSIQDFIDEDGNFCLRLGTPTYPYINIVNEDEKAFKVYINNDGELVSEEVFDFTGLNDGNRVFKKPSNDLAKITINNQLELVTASVDSISNNVILGKFVRKVILKSENSQAWVVGINDNDEIMVETVVVDGGWFKIKNQENQTVFGVNAGNQGLNHLAVFNQSTLPTQPQYSNSLVPWAFLEKDSTRLPVYFDGTVWRYFYNNQSVDI